ncbi:hypothetical protein SKAU_G00087640 [Synaphobranchus kaupii]|uniref:SWIM-type domain-containing protein n=1 Tax=Synaphobranchus kaupii TaxID=118154 RepID=A0A9Q1FWY6_SYNKA|nr:hypothetical protein SKAU_G00087640 [Synaphobranchus kaupii]
MCLLTSAIMKMTLRDSDPVVLVNSFCSCVAGSGVCNHVVALLYQTAHYSECGMSAVPPVLSCTETEQKWHKPRTMGVKPGPVDAMVVVKPKPGATTSSGIRSALYKGYSGELPDPSSLDTKAAYAGFKPDSTPLICTMDISPDKPLVDSIFGKVQAGSILSYQHPPPTTDGVITHEDAPPFPKVPLEGYQLNPTDCTFVPTNQEQLYLRSLSVTLSQSHNIEEATRCQSATPEWHSLRKERVTASTFRQVSHVGPSAADNLAERIIRGTRQTAIMKRGLDLEAGALKDYATLKNMNSRKCGLVIHPDAPWLGASPDGVVYDPLERPSFGLVEMKCPNALNYIDCSYLRVDHGTHKLKENHPYYWQVQGQLLITGMEWCDFVVCAHDDMFVQRIYRHTTVLNTIKQRCDLFYFCTYLPKYLSMHQ